MVKRKFKVQLEVPIWYLQNFTELKKKKRFGSRQCNNSVGANINQPDPDPSTVQDIHIHQLYKKQERG